MATVENVRINYITNKDELVATRKETDALDKSTDELTKSTEQANKKFKESDKQLASTNSLLSGLGGQLQSAANRVQIFGVGVGDAGAKLLGASKSIDTATKATKLWGLALKAALIPLTAIAVAITGLITLFARSQAGQDKIAQAWGRIGAVTDVVIASFSRLEEIFTSLISFDFSNIAAQFREIGEEINGAIDGADRIAETNIRIRELEIEITAATATRRRQIQDLLIITRDFTQEFETQAQALQRANELELANQRDRVRLATERLTLATQELQETPRQLQTDEQRLEVAKAAANLQEEIANSTAKQRELLNRVNELESRRLSTIARITKEQRDVLAETDESDEITSVQNRLFEFDEEKALSDIERARQLQEQVIAQRLESTRNAIAFELQEEQALAQAKLQIANNLFDSIQQVAGEQSQLGKLAAIAQAIINVKEAVTKALTAAPPPFNFALAASVAAFGAIQVNEIRKQRVPGFKEGVIGLTGPGTETSDSIPAFLSRGESVMTAEETRRFNPTLKAIREGLISPDILNKIVQDGGTSINVINDQSKIADAIRKQPVNVINVDEDGIHSYFTSKTARSAKRVRRYSTKSTVK